MTSQLELIVFGEGQLFWVLAVGGCWRRQVSCEAQVHHSNRHSTVLPLVRATSLEEGSTKYYSEHDPYYGPLKCIEGPKVIVSSFRDIPRLK